MTPRHIYRPLRFSLDVTRHIKAEQSSKRSRNKSNRKIKQVAGIESRIIEFFPDATFVTDPAGGVIFWNKAMEELTGIASKDILGKTLSACSLKGVDGKHLCMTFRAQQGGG